MTILAFDCASQTASGCLWRDGVPVAHTTLNNGLTHSQNLLPLIDGLFALSGLAPQDADLVGVTNGPGSFTGLRIGLATAAGFAFGQDIRVCPVSSLQAAAHALAHTGDLVCAVMDARCRQVYTALFCSDGHTLARLTPDEALSLDQLRERLSAYDKRIWLTGDGAAICESSLQLAHAQKAPVPLAIPQAWSVAQLTDEMNKQGASVPPEDLRAVYLRVPQAERERLKKENRL